MNGVKKLISPKATLPKKSGNKQKVNMRVCKPLKILGKEKKAWQKK